MKNIGYWLLTGATAFVALVIVAVVGLVSGLHAGLLFGFWAGGVLLVCGVGAFAIGYKIQSPTMLTLTGATVVFLSFAVEQSWGLAVTNGVMFFGASMVLAAIESEFGENAESAEVVTLPNLISPVKPYEEAREAFVERLRRLVSRRQPARLTFWEGPERLVPRVERPFSYLWVKGFALKLIFQQHPSKPGYWRIHAREIGRERVPWHLNPIRLLAGHERLPSNGDLTVTLNAATVGDNDLTALLNLLESFDWEMISRAAHLDRSKHRLAS